MATRTHPQRTLAVRRLLLVLALALTDLLGVGTLRVAARDAAPYVAAPYVFDVYRPTAVSSQASAKLAFGAAVQTMRNHVKRTTDRSPITQARYARYVRTHTSGRSLTAKLAGWEDALDRYVSTGRYSVVRRPSARAALKLAAARLRVSGRPVGLIVARGAKPLVMTGFTATTDPVNGKFALTGISVVDTGFPGWPALGSASGAAVRNLSFTEASQLLAPKGGRMSVLVPAVPKRIRQVALGLSQHPDTGLTALDAATARFGRVPAIWSLWSSWGDASNGFPATALLDGIVARGSTPILFWNPVGSDITDPSFQYKRIVAGDHDAYIRSWAQAAKAWNKPLLLRFAQEMNGSWFPWGVGRFGNTAKNFVKAWRHVFTIVRTEVGASRVRFVWSPYSPAGCSACPSYKSIWPGDAYVDYAGFSVFDWNGNIKAVNMFRPPVKAITAITRKPIIVAETATPPRGKRKAAWLRDGYPAVYTAFPSIVAIVYFDVRVTGQPDWRLTKPLAAQRAYAKLLTDRRFQGHIE